jgi:hypothetical protein
MNAHAHFACDGRAAKTTSLKLSTLAPHPSRRRDQSPAVNMSATTKKVGRQSTCGRPFAYVAQSILVDRLVDLIATIFVLHIVPDIRAFLIELNDMPDDPERDTRKHHFGFGTLKRINRADVRKIHGPGRNSIGRHLFLLELSFN